MTEYVGDRVLALTYDWVRGWPPPKRISLILFVCVILENMCQYKNFNNCHYCQWCVCFFSGGGAKSIKIYVYHIYILFLEICSNTRGWGFLNRKRNIYLFNYTYYSWKKVPIQDLRSLNVSIWTCLRYVNTSYMDTKLWKISVKYIYLAYSSSLNFHMHKFVQKLSLIQKMSELKNIKEGKR